MGDMGEGFDGRVEGGDFLRRWGARSHPLSLGRTLLVRSAARNHLA